MFYFSFSTSRVSWGDFVYFASFFFCIFIIMLHQLSCFRSHFRRTMLGCFGWYASAFDHLQFYFDLKSSLDKQPLYDLRRKRRRKKKCYRYRWTKITRERDRENISTEKRERKKTKAKTNWAISVLNFQLVSIVSHWTVFCWENLAQHIHTLTNTCKHIKECQQKHQIGYIHSKANWIKTLQKKYTHTRPKK